MSLIEQVPAYLFTPATSDVPPPVEQRQQELPYDKLSWRNFERLCLRLAQLDADVEGAKLYGEPGEDQAGIDLFGRLRSSGAYRVYQCKNEQDFGAAKIAVAVQKFLKDEWGIRSKSFVLCTRESLKATQRTKEIEKQRALLAQNGISFEQWDRDELDLKLKTLPHLVDDFFGRQWVMVFCGSERAAALGHRLDVGDVQEFRTKLATFYERVFQIHDPGLPALDILSKGSFHIHQRYVVPDILIQRESGLGYTTDVASDPTGSVSLERYELPNGSRSIRGQLPERRQELRYPSQQRLSVARWITRNRRSVILADFGRGKSALLRFLAIDLLQQAPRLADLAQQWGSYLPVWVPFALWVRWIAHPATSHRPLEDLLHSWLASQSEERLWPVVQKALGDERLLLLIDGLDEWNDESAALIAFQRLELFIKQRDLPAIATGRPAGVQRLTIPTQEWQVGELAPLSSDQQKVLARGWFRFWIQFNWPDAPLESETEERLGALLRDLTTPGLRELASVALLLCLLISLKLKNIKLPENRFRAYELLVDHLVSVHPRRRRSSAGIPDAPDTLPDQEVKRLLGYLAYEIQQRYGEGIILEQEALSLAESYLRDDDRGFDGPEARRHASAVIRPSQPSTGLIIRKSEDQIGFFHRAFQEFLAAFHLCSLDSATQVEMLKNHCLHSKWQETILALFYLTRKPEEIATLVRVIREVPKNLPQRHQSELLLCEVACGDFRLPAALAKSIILESTEIIETGYWMPQRIKLLRRLLRSLGSQPLRDILRSKVRSWFPSRGRWREQLFDELANWPAQLDLFPLLWRGLHDEEASNMRAAAAAIARRYRGSAEKSNRVATLAGEAIDPDVRSAAIECLLNGWPEHGALASLIDHARKSPDPRLRWIAIAGNIMRRTHDSDDLNELIALGSTSSRLEFHRRLEIGQLLLSGWPGNEELKTRCLLSLDRPSSPHLEPAIGWHVLLHGYPHDPQVASRCVHEIQTKAFPFNSLMGPLYEPWDMLSRHFGGDSQLVTAADAWITKQQETSSFHEPQVSFAALVGKTAIGKSALLHDLHGSVPHWATSALLKGWGMEDTDVRNALQSAAIDRSFAPRIAPFIPQIIKDKEESRNILMTLLSDPGCSRPDFVLQGLEDIGEARRPEVLESVLKFNWNTSDPFKSNLAHFVIEVFPEDPRVRIFAEQALHDVWSLQVAIAFAYRDDESIREQITNMVAPLPAPLRTLIAAELGIEAFDSFAESMLTAYRIEEDPEVSCTASIGYHEQLLSSNRDVSLAVTDLTKGILAIGVDNMGRRQAALAGLIALDRLDIFRDARESSTSQPASIDLGYSHRPSPAIARYAAENWGRIVKVLGPDAIDRFRGISLDRNDAWRALCDFADEFPDCRDAALVAIERAEPKLKGASILRFLSRSQTRSGMLLDRCLDCLDATEGDPETASLAAELLAKHFSGDEAVLSRILALAAGGRGTSDVAALAVCEGWSSYPKLQQWFERVCRVEAELSTFAAAYPIIWEIAEPDEALQKLLDLITRAPQRFPYRQAAVRTFMRRLARDQQLTIKTMANLTEEPTASLATIARLLSGAGRRSSELMQWCLARLEEEVSGSRFPSMGYDLLSASFQPVATCLLEVLSGFGDSELEL